MDPWLRTYDVEYELRERNLPLVSALLLADDIEAQFGIEAQRSVNTEELQTLSSNLKNKV
jgi:hypothetical protein